VKRLSDHHIYRIVDNTAKAVNLPKKFSPHRIRPVSYTHLRAHETKANLVCRLLLEKKKKTTQTNTRQKTLSKIKHKTEMVAKLILQLTKF